jgi:long-chain fatty acid transport protein
LSVTHELNDRWSISSDVQWTQWSTFKSTNFTGDSGVFVGQNQGYHDSWFVSIGAVYKLTDDWTLRGGLGWDQSPVDDRYRIVGLPDQDRYMAAIGFGYKFNDHWSADGSYAHYFASHGSVSDSVNSSTAGIVAGTNVLSGTYQLSIDYLAASVRYKF